MAVTLALVTGTGILQVASTAVAAPPASPEPTVTTPSPGPAAGSGADRYFSTPPGPRPRPQAQSEARLDPSPPPTRGNVTGRVLDPAGRPLPGVLVTGVRFVDLGNPPYDENELPLLTRTQPDGRFSLPQLTERYLVKLCHAEPDEEGCSTDPGRDTFLPTYVGPDGTTDSWVLQTRMFRPQPSGRELGRVTVKPVAVLDGTYTDGAHRAIRLVRGDHTVAARTAANEDGRFRFEVAPGAYWLETSRDEGLDTVATVPGSRTKVRLGVTKPTKITVANRSASHLTGLVTRDGEPLAGEVLVVLDTHGRFAGGVMTDEDGRYTFNSLKPGRYTISNRGLFGEYVVQRQTVRLSATSTVRTDFELDAGGTIELTPVDIPEAQLAVDLRNAQGRVVKSYPIREVEPANGLVRFNGLAPGRYEVVAVRTSDGQDTGADTEFPWATRTVTITPGARVTLGRVPLDRPTLNLTGSVPRGESRVEFTTVLEDEYLRDDFVQGGWGTPITAGWTNNPVVGGSYLVRGFVPGRYLATVATALIEPDDGQSRTGADVATTRRWVRLRTDTTRLDLPAPRGAVVRGGLRYAGSHRPLIAPVGVRATDRGDRSFLLPTVSGPQTSGGGYRIDRLHTGPVRLDLLELQAFADQIERLTLQVPLSLQRSAPTSEDRTPYYLHARTRQVRVQAGRTTGVSPIDVKVRGR